MLNSVDKVLIFEDPETDMIAEISAESGFVRLEYFVPEQAVSLTKRSFKLGLSRGEFLDFAQDIEDLAKQVRKNTKMPEAVE